MTMGTLTTRDSCIHEILWLFRRGIVLGIRRRGFVRNAWAHVGAGLLTLAAALIAGTFAGALTGHRANRQPGFGYLIALGAAVLAGGAGATAVCFGTHGKRSGGNAVVAGADVFLNAASPDAPLGILVTVGGYGSESPAFCEPAFVNHPELAPDELRSQLSRFRYRVAVRLQGGLGWQFSDTLAVADSLEKLLQTAPLAAVAALPCVVVAHSRGTQIAAATRTFRATNWQRFAVHPPAGVNPLLRLFSRVSPEIAEIHRCGAFMAETASAAGNSSTTPTSTRERLAGFPWTVLYQAKGWDHTVIRFPPAPGQPVLNLSPWGTHTLPFAVGTSRVWRDLQARIAAIAPVER